MRSTLISFTLLFAIWNAASAAGQTMYAPLPVEYSAPLADEPKDLPLVTIGRLTGDAKSPVRQAGLDDSYYKSFRDNQIGKNYLDDFNASAFLDGKLKLLPAIEGQEIAVAVAIPELENCSVTVGQPTYDGKNSLQLTMQQWKTDEAADAKSSRAGHVEMVYLPPLAAGKYQLVIQWHVMTAANANQGYGYSWTDFKVGEMEFEVEPANRDRFHEPQDAPAMKFDALHPVPMPKMAEDIRVQTPWLMTARRFSDFGNVKEGLYVGAGKPFDFLRGDPQQRFDASSLPKLNPPKSDQSLYAMILCAQMQSFEWTGVRHVQWEGNNVVIDCDRWTDSGDRTKNILNHPMLLVQLIPPAAKPALEPITPPGHYTLKVVWHNLVAPQPGGWYAEQSQRTEQIEFDVKTSNN